MNESVHSTLAAWGTFYQIAGAAAAALTGLQFVVQTLIASKALGQVGGRDPEGGIAAFGSPTVVHFSLALLVSALLCAPWAGYEGLRTPLGALAIGALIYSAIVLRRARAQRTYVPGMEDWLWHIIFPVIAYGSVLAASILLHRDETWPLFMVGAATLLLICIGIHNAWDTVTYLTITALQSQASGTTPTAPVRNQPKARGKKRR